MGHVGNVGFYSIYVLVILEKRTNKSRSPKYNTQTRDQDIENNYRTLEQHKAGAGV